MTAEPVSIMAACDLECIEMDLIRLTQQVIRGEAERVQGDSNIPTGIRLWIFLTA